MGCAVLSIPSRLYADLADSLLQGDLTRKTVDGGRRPRELKCRAPRNLPPRKGEVAAVAELRTTSGLQINGRHGATTHYSTAHASP